MIFRKVARNIKNNFAVYLTALFFLVSSLLMTLFYSSIETAYTRQMFVFFYEICTLGFISIEGLLISRKLGFKSGTKKFVLRAILLGLLAFAMIVATMIVFTMKHSFANFSSKLYAVLEAKFINSAFSLSSTFLNTNFQQNGVLYLNLDLMSFVFVINFTILAIAVISQATKLFSKDEGTCELVVKSERSYDITLEEKSNVRNLSVGYLYKVIP